MFATYVTHSNTAVPFAKLTALLPRVHILFTQYLYSGGSIIDWETIRGRFFSAFDFTLHYTQTEYLLLDS